MNGLAPVFTTLYGLPCVELRGCAEFKPAAVFECGQCFRWNPLPENGQIYVGVAGGRAAAVQTVRDISGEDFVLLLNVEPADYESFWKPYFDLERDYGALRSALAAKDSFLAEAAAFGAGIRLLRQEPFETLISFILSSNNNIPRIKGCVERLCAAYGEPIVPEPAFRAYLCEYTVAEKVPELFYAFPTPERLAASSAEEISRCCKAGYRSDYVAKTARAYVERPISVREIRAAELGTARKILSSYTGVGPKVADCVLLFAGLRTDVFPVDVWVRRVLERLYFRREVTLREAEAFTAEYFGELAGFAQQYLFYNIRENGL